MLDCVANELCVLGYSQFFHDPDFVKPHGPVGNLQEAGNLLQGAAFGEHLQHFSLAIGQMLRAVHSLRVSKKNRS